MDNNFSHIICHYGEIGLKGKNRPTFEKQLVENIKKSLKLHNLEFGAVKRISGRILIESPDSDKEGIRDCISSVFGIVNFSESFEVENDIESIKEKALELAKDKDFNTFAIDTIRSDKSFKLNSQQVNEKIGEYVLENTKSEVDLDNPDFTVYIEIVEDRVFLYTKKIQGSGGLPVGSSSKALVLMSGGIDSPVAAYMAAKRGVELVFAHFHSYPHTSKESIQKVRDLVKKLNKYNMSSTVYMIPFADIQKDIISSVGEDLRVVFYRRFMMKIACKIAREENCEVLVTGESVGQVASQTLENIRAISDASDLPILRPLIGMDKQEIIKIAKDIDTFETSIRLADDTCTRFMPQNPATKASLDKVLKEEKKLDVDSIVEKGVSEAELEQVEGLLEN